MKRLLSSLILPVALAAALLLPSAWAQQDSGDAISTHDGRGNFSTVYNLFDGQRYGIQVTRMTSSGYVQWTQQHSDGLIEKAHAAAMDGDGGLFIAGVRRHQDRKFMLLLKYDKNGWLSQEWADPNSDCAALAAGVDPTGNVTVAGTCKYENASPARVLHFNNDGALLWADDYDGGGRNYVRDLQVDVQGNISLTVETVSGNMRDGSYGTHVIVYNDVGQKIEVR